MWQWMLLIWIGNAPQEASVRGPESTCVQCHRQQKDKLLEPVRLAAEDVHFQKGLSCHSCHGGDPGVGIDMERRKDSMSRAKGYIGIPSRKQVATLCASCHGNLDYMRKFNPQARVDQYTEYLTSAHGRKYQAGDLKVATCTDCHRSHGIRAVSDPKGPVYPTNVAATCSSCHADAVRMEPYKLPTNQIELYRKSVHGEALLKQRDISAPTCNDCHGNHGAQPPGVDSVANVCGQCHTNQWDLFTRSPHKKAFAEQELPACVTCHEHHDIARTSDAMLGVEESANCVSCHEKGTAGYAAAADMKAGIQRLTSRIEAARSVLEQAERAGMEVSRPIYHLSDGKDRLVRARVEIHRFDAAELRKILDEGEKIAAESEASGWKALGDLAYRRKGLAVSVLILLAMIGLLLVKIRQLPS